MVYEMTKSALAEYLSNTINGFVVEQAISTPGRRIKKKGEATAYDVEVCSIRCDAIKPKVDCFLNLDESISVRVYLPTYKYWARTNELSPAYKKGAGWDNRTFDFESPARDFVYVIPSSMELSSYEDFEKAMLEHQKRICSELVHDMNLFRNNADWKFSDVTCDISFRVDANIKEGMYGLCR